MAGQKWDIKGIYIFEVETDPIKIKQSIKRMEELSIHIERISWIGENIGWESPEMRFAQIKYKEWQQLQKDGEQEQEGIA